MGSRLGSLEDDAVKFPFRRKNNARLNRRIPTAYKRLIEEKPDITVKRICTELAEELDCYEEQIYDYIKETAIRLYR